MMVTLYLFGCWARVAAQDWRPCQSVPDGGGKLRRILTIPAAPPPTMTTFFLLVPFLSLLRSPSEDMVTIVEYSAGD